MGATNKSYSITDATGAVPTITAYDKRDTVWLRNVGPDDVSLARAGTDGVYVRSVASVPNVVPS